MILVFAILLFLSVALLVAGVFMQRNASGSRAVAERLRSIAPRGSAEPGKDVARDERYSSMGWLDAILRRLNLGRHLELQIYQAGLNVRGGALVLLTAGIAMAGYFIGVTVFQRLMPGLVFMLLLGPLPYVYVRVRKHQRMKAFAREFPDALDLLVSGLRAGLSLSAAMQILAEESPEPVRGEFAILVEEAALGLDFREAMINMTERVDVLDLRFFVTAVLLQRETGGNLAEVLSNTATLIRERFRILGDIQTYTAQGKLTGLILVCLPLGVALFTWLTAPAYFAPMMQSQGGQNALWAALGMQLLGVFVIMRLVNIKV
jgi:tight adherence protein B